MEAYNTYFIAVDRVSFNGLKNISCISIYRENECWKIKSDRRFYAILLWHVRCSFIFNIDIFLCKKYFCKNGIKILSTHIIYNEQYGK